MAVKKKILWYFDRISGEIGQQSELVYIAQNDCLLPLMWLIYFYKTVVHIWTQ